MREVHDVIVVGAGPAGSAAAHFLAARGVDVALLDRAAFPRDKTCGDGLTPRAVGVLDEMGLLPDLLPVGQRITGVEVVAPDGSHTAAPILARGGLPPMLVVPRIALDNVIRKRAVTSGARFEGRVTVTAIDRTGEGVTVCGERDGQPVSLRARMAVVATGASTALLTRLGILPGVPPMMLAVRAYVEGMRRSPDRIQIRFDGVPLPGYGWVFPVSESSSNVGAGFFLRGAGRRAVNVRTVFDRFLTSPAVAAQFNGGRQAGPVKGYPLRVDFPAFPSSSDRVLLVGEAAGLVNPLTGEGIDYALESARVAAGHAARMLAAGDLSEAACRGYDREVRTRFARLFVFCRRVRDTLVHPLMLIRLVRIAARREDLRRGLIDLVLGNREVPRLSVRAVAGRILVGRG